MASEGYQLPPRQGCHRYDLPRDGLAGGQHVSRGCSDAPGAVARRRRPVARAVPTV